MLDGIANGEEQHINQEQEPIEQPVAVREEVARREESFTPLHDASKVSQKPVDHERQPKRLDKNSPQGDALLRKKRALYQIGKRSPEEPALDCVAVWKRCIIDRQKQHISQERV